VFENRVLEESIWT